MSMPDGVARSLPTAAHARTRRGRHARSIAECRRRAVGVDARTRCIGAGDEAARSPYGGARLHGRRSGAVVSVRVSAAGQQPLLAVDCRRPGSGRPAARISVADDAFMSARRAPRHPATVIVATTPASQRPKEIGHAELRRSRKSCKKRRRSRIALGQYCIRDRQGPCTSRCHGRGGAPLRRRRRGIYKERIAASNFVDNDSCGRHRTLFYDPNRDL